MKNKHLLVIVVTALCTTLVGCTGNKKAPPNKVWFAYSTENLISDWDYFNGKPENLMYANRDKTLRFKCLKNENEGAQLMITANNYIASFDFELPDVSGDSGTISKDNFSVSVAHYMNVDYSNEKESMGGLYPDALIPLKNYKFRRMNFIDKGRSQSLYINLRTQNDTPAGEYKGIGKLHLDNEVIDIPFEVKVYDATLPSEVHQNAAFGIWYEQIEKGEKDNIGPEINRNYYDFIVEKRISPRELPPELTTDSNEFTDFIKNYVDLVAKNEKIAGLRLPITSFDC